MLVSMHNPDIEQQVSLAMPMKRLCQKCLPLCHPLGVIHANSLLLDIPLMNLLRRDLLERPQDYTRLQLVAMFVAISLRHTKKVITTLAKWQIYMYFRPCLPSPVCQNPALHIDMVLLVLEQGITA